MSSSGRLPAPGTVLATLAELLSPTMEALGLRGVRDTGVRSWRSDAMDGDVRTFASIQVDSKAMDPYAGGGFRIEVERSPNARPAMGINGRALFFQLLLESELEALLDHQNAYIRSLVRPPSDHVILYPPGSVRDMYLSYFDEQRSFDAILCWLWYLTVDDLRAWTVVINPLLPALVSRAAEVLRPDARHLGRGSLV